MNNVKPIYWKLLGVVVVIYVMAVSLIQKDLYEKVGVLEHAAMHAAEGVQGDKACHH